MERSQFTDEAQRVISLAHDEATRLAHDYVGTEHLLLALMRESLLANQLIVGLQIVPVKIVDELGMIIQPGDEPVAIETLPYTQRAETALRYAREQAMCAGGRVDSGHLLLGLLSAQEGVASQVLANLGVRLEDVRDRLQSKV